VATARYGGINNNRGRCVNQRYSGKVGQNAVAPRTNRLNRSAAAARSGEFLPLAAQWWFHNPGAGCESILARAARAVRCRRCAVAKVGAVRKARQTSATFHAVTYLVMRERQRPVRVPVSAVCANAVLSPFLLLWRCRTASRNVQSEHAERFHAVKLVRGRARRERCQLSAAV